MSSNEAEILSRQFDEVIEFLDENVPTTSQQPHSIGQQQFHPRSHYQITANVMTNDSTNVITNDSKKIMTNDSKKVMTNDSIEVITNDSYDSTPIRNYVPSYINSKRHRLSQIDHLEYGSPKNNQNSNW